eukprot:TRINITY_DN813_c0_g1_i3.p1 TRINITY_DN813_c0_g1~~TRINITY_DN813_c0_g1_i3.p1  ORF type:complete len:553 (-),score=116.86 TRINITY_DN813_c0_g1_i3:345-2003(-)
MIACGLDEKRAISVIGFNSPEWFIAAYGVIHAGGIITGIYTTNSPDQCLYVTDHSDSQLVFVENLTQLAKYKAIKSQIPQVKKIVVMDNTADPDGWAITWNKFMSMGETVLDTTLQGRINAITLHDVCSLIYTSGTTGNPKGVMITHRNVTWVSKSVMKIFPLTSQDRVLSYLPLSHIAEQVAGLYLPLFIGGHVSFATPDALKGALVNSLKEVRPTAFFGVPRVWEKVESALKAAGATRTGVSKMISTWAKKKGLEGSLRQIENRDPGFTFRMLQKSIFKKVKAALGFDECKFFFTGAAPTSRATLEYFMSLDIQVYEIFGMSEVTGPTMTNFPGWHKLGSVGPVFGNGYAKIFDDGELCLKGPFVSKGYWKDPEATSNTIDSDGWLHTGDIGKIDEEGFVFITDRKKELIITAGGENIAPTAIEAKMKTIPGIGQFVTFGDRQKYLVALVVLDPDNFKKVGSTIGSSAQTLAEASKCPIFQKHFDQGVAEVNKTLAQVQTIKKVKVLPTEFAFEGDNAEMTATMKLRRHIIYKKYAKEIEEMYGADYTPK